MYECKGAGRGIPLDPSESSFGQTTSGIKEADETVKAIEEKQKGPQVLAHLAGGIEIISNSSIPQNELIETLCDADMTTTNLQYATLRNFIPVSDFTMLGSEDSGT